MNIKYQKLDGKASAQLKPLMSALGYSLSENEVARNILGVRHRGGEIFVAESDDVIVGCVCAIIDARLAAGSYGEIVSLVVLEPYKGKGIGKGLVECAERWIRKRSDKIRVRANVIRSHAHRFYQSLGFREVKTQKIFTKNLHPER